MAKDCNQNRYASKAREIETASGKAETYIDERINLADISISDLLKEIFSRYREGCVLMSLCSRNEDGSVEAFHHLAGNPHLLLGEAELLRYEVMKQFQEALKKNAV